MPPDLRANPATQARLEASRGTSRRRLRIAIGIRVLILLVVAALIARESFETPRRGRGFAGVSWRTWGVGLGTMALVGVGLAMDVRRSRRLP